MIEFSRVRFSYDGDAFVLDGINLRIERGQFVCILGGNGSGKSTLAKHIDALLVPDEGEVEVLGRNTKDESATYFIRSNAGLVFQNPDDQLVASLIENDVAFGPENLGVPAEELRTRVSEALADVGLQGFDKRETSALSGGQKQRVAIAGVLAMDPAILVLDEATAMLDPRGRKGLLRVCRELHERGMTVIMITHFMEEAAQTERVFVLDAGRVHLHGPTEEVLVQAQLLEHLNLDIPFASKLSLLLQQQG
ncbi:MAG: energy-coupling factor transporter ATPase, partial [Chloroflexi bacterium]|nr:energy-coupling factor transporter ATPase [Chloroflexota bacterium]